MGREVKRKRGCAVKLEANATSSDDFDGRRECRESRVEQGEQGRPGQVRPRDIADSRERGGTRERELPLSCTVLGGRAEVVRAERQWEEI